MVDVQYRIAEYGDGAQLTDDQIRMLYQIDERPDWLYVSGASQNNSDIAQIIIEERGEQDVEQISRVLSEKARADFANAKTGYSRMLEKISFDSEAFELSEEVLDRYMDKWENSGLFASLAREVLTGRHYSLVALPNIDISLDQLRRMETTDLHLTAIKVEGDDRRMVSVKDGNEPIKLRFIEDSRLTRRKNDLIPFFEGETTTTLDPAFANLAATEIRQQSINLWMQSGFGENDRLDTATVIELLAFYYSHLENRSVELPAGFFGILDWQIREVDTPGSETPYYGVNFPATTRLAYAGQTSPQLGKGKYVSNPTAAVG
jgi:hypothetical protein